MENTLHGNWWLAVSWWLATVNWCLGVVLGARIDPRILLKAPLMARIVLKVLLKAQWLECLESF